MFGKSSYSKQSQRGISRFKSGKREITDQCADFYDAFARFWTKLKKNFSTGSTAECCILKWHTNEHAHGFGIEIGN